MIKKSKGFTLLEVMLAMVISAVALLGLASLQAQSLSFNQTAYIRSQATYFAYDMLEKMRMNRNAANSGSYDMATTDTPNSATCYGTGSTCSEASFAAADKYEWYSLITSTLPGGAGSVSRATGTGETIVTILVQWNNLNATGTSKIQVSGEL
ncbi:MAG: type IV pilus modification protein PilV [Gammaproteobacteria bacterium]|nr:type IV pilus modification protein PilV [Gammaproteobacteria bacterium]